VTSEPQHGPPPPHGLRQDKEESKEIETPMGLSLLGAYEEDEDDEPEPSPPSNKVFFYFFSVRFCTVVIHVFFKSFTTTILHFCVCI
jgi:hypothetical protein